MSQVAEKQDDSPGPVRVTLERVRQHAKRVQEAAKLLSDAMRDAAAVGVMAEVSVERDRSSDGPIIGIDVTTRVDPTEYD